MLKSIKIELMKIKRSGIIIVCTLFPLLAVLHGYSLAQNIEKSEMSYFGEMFFSRSTLVYGMLILPLLITVIFAIIGRIENVDNSWKQLLTMPIKRGNAYLSKLILGCSLILFNFFILTVGILIAALIVSENVTIPWNIIVLRPILAFISSLPIIAIQFYLSLRFKNVGVSLGIGAIFTLPIILIANSTKYWIFYPWTYPLLTLIPNLVGNIDQTNEYIIMFGVSILSFIAIITIGLNEFRKKDII